MRQTMGLLIILLILAGGGGFFLYSQPIAAQDLSSCRGVPEPKITIGKDGYTAFQNYAIWFSSNPNSQNYYSPPKNMLPLAEKAEQGGCYSFPSGQAIIFADPNIFSMQDVTLPNIPYQLIIVFNNALLGEDREAVVEILQKVPDDIFTPQLAESSGNYVFVLVTAEHVVNNPSNLPLTPDEGPLLVTIPKDPKKPQALERLIQSFKTMHQKRLEYVQKTN